MAGVLVSVEGKSESETPGLTFTLITEALLRERLLRRFGVGDASPRSSVPLAASSLVILVPILFNMFSRAAMRSPPASVLFRDKPERKGGGVGDGDGS